ncbi:MAG: VRR-NUC domain-containing protein [Bacillota bacterium]|nr:VRR-NUC domain-containing protein [Bacillota bacterium]MDW7677840.1 VRR-NUC domain-containing protein [Bacillota bacterium]
MTERHIERNLKREVEKRGGMALKFISPSMSGVPDRLVLIQHGRACFVELKAPGKPLRTLQRYRKRQLESLGFEVWVIDSMEGIETFLREVME